MTDDNDNKGAVILHRLEAAKRRLAGVLGIEYSTVTGTSLLLNAAATYIEAGRTDRSISDVMGMER